MNRQFLADFLAPGFDDFTDAAMEDLSSRYPTASHWIASYLLSSVFHGEYPVSVKPLVFNIIFRAQAAFKSYHKARSLTRAYLDFEKRDLQSTDPYFEAVSEWETTILNLKNAQDLFSKNIDQKLYEKCDGSDDQRLAEIANRIKHCAADIENGGHDATLTIPMWLSNGGLVTRTARLSWDELASNVDGLAKIAQTLHQPASAMEKYQKIQGDSTRPDIK